MVWQNVVELSEPLAERAGGANAVSAELPPEGGIRVDEECLPRYCVSYGRFITRYRALCGLGTIKHNARRF